MNNMKLKPGETELPAGLDLGPYNVLPDNAELVLEGESESTTDTGPAEVLAEEMSLLAT